MTTFEGADISHYQNEAGPINWQALKDGSPGNYFACKGTQRTSYLDPFCKRNRQNSENMGFRYRLIYHWQSPISQGAIKAQCEWYFSQIGTLDQGEGFMLDSEERGIASNESREMRMRFEDKYQRPGVIYTGAFVAGLWTDETVFTPQTGRHLAAYTTEDKAKKLPGIKQFPWDFWQYSSNGPVPGVTGRCDMNRIDQEAKLEVICGYATHPVGEDMRVWLLQDSRSVWCTSDFVSCRQVSPDDIVWFAQNGLVKMDGSNAHVDLVADGIINNMKNVKESIVVPSVKVPSYNIPSVPGVATPI